MKHYLYLTAFFVFCIGIFVYGGMPMGSPPFEPQLGQGPGFGPQFGPPPRSPETSGPQFAQMTLPTAERTPYVMTFFFRPLPYDPKKNSAESFDEKVHTPGALSESLLVKNLLSNHLVNSIFATYAGYFALSDMNGQVIFPRKNQKPRIKILVTRNIKPIFEPSIETPTKTIHHWELVEPAQAKYYETELKQDPDIKLYFWSTRQKKLPKKQRIPNDTLIIFAEPKYIIIPTGPIKLGINTAHFLLPDIFVSPEINRALDALWFLKVKKYFGPIKTVYKFEKQGYLSQINV